MHHVFLAHTVYLAEDPAMSSEGAVFIGFRSLAAVAVPGRTSGRLKQHSKGQYVDDHSIKIDGLLFTVIALDGHSGRLSR